jgi:hypothetical protein
MGGFLSLTVIPADAGISYSQSPPMIFDNKYNYIADESELIILRAYIY